jgi:hypothetical protein
VRLDGLLPDRRRDAVAADDYRAGMSHGRAHEHVVVSVEAGSDATEELAVAVVGDGTYRLLEPPALTFGLAKGDVFAIDAETRRPRVLSRSRNLTLWLYPGEAVDEARALTTEVERVGGMFDGTAPSDRLYIFTVPVEVTFPVVEAIFERFSSRHPGAEWYFGNVYADDGVTPLGWWDDEATHSA